MHTLPVLTWVIASTAALCACSKATGARARVYAPLRALVHAATAPDACLPGED